MKCEWCKQEKTPLVSHHVLPRWLIPLERNTDIMQVCRGCHVKLDARIRCFLFWGQFKSVKWKDRDRANRNGREYYLKNKERIKAQRKQHYHANKERLIKTQKEYYRANCERIKTYARERHHLKNNKNL